MRGRDSETGEFLSPSRSEQRREALAVFALGESLVALSAGQLERMPLSEEVRAAVLHTRRITAPIARKRELQHLAKVMRNEEAEALEAIRAALEADRAGSRRETAALHRVETWRERLLAEGDAALTEFMDAHPGADAQQLRQLIRKAAQEQAKGRPPHAYRELFRQLRELSGDGG